MFKASANRSLTVRVLCILSIALVCALGIVQAVHTHAETSTASHHTCSICSAAHAGLNVETVTTAPVLAVALIAAPLQQHAGIFRAAAVQFIRPPPAA
jgi:hypothetical protein